MKELGHGYYATRIYLPLSDLSRRWRTFTRRIRGNRYKFHQATRLPRISWRHCTPRRAIRIWEHGKLNGNVRISELGILSAMAATCEEGSNLFEIGTFDGRTTLNLALNSPSGCQVYTLDLPPDMETKFSIAAGERHMVEKPAPGVRYKNYRDSNPQAVAGIHQLLGDSATFDFSPYENSCSLVFVDGSHAYDYAISDTLAAMRMVKKGGVIIWHDYGVWEGVTRALEEMEERHHWDFRNISGTSLVYWRNNQEAQVDLNVEL